jgi:hypothetical protein
VLFHAKQEQALLAQPGAQSAVLVGCRADNRQPLAAELELLQNGHWADGERRYFVPHWPQPGLQPRDPSRGLRLERLAYKGFLENLAPAFRGAAGRAALAARGIEWLVDAPRFAGVATDLQASAWADYREVDGVLAVRAERAGRLHSKPATKLTNAWLAGALPLVGPEPAFREVGVPGSDYLEVASPAEALDAIDRLRAEPALLARILDAGRRRAPEFGTEAILARWRQLLLETLPAAAAGPGPARRRRWPLSARRAGRWLARLWAGRPAR